VAARSARCDGGGRAQHSRKRIAPPRTFFLFGLASDPQHTSAAQPALGSLASPPPGAVCGTAVRGQQVEKHHGALLFLIRGRPWAAGGEATWGGMASPPVGISVEEAEARLWTAG
jgi:hypothetical protein